MPDFISMSSLPLIRQLIKLNNEGSSYYYYQHFSHLTHPFTFLRLRPTVYFRF